MPRASQHRASGGQAGTDPPEADWSRNERPATRHGLAPSFGGGDRGLGGLVVGGFSGFRGRLSPNGPPSRRVGYRGPFGDDPVLGRLGVGGFSGFRGLLSPNGPPSRRLAPGGFYGDLGSCGVNAAPLRRRPAAGKQ